MRSRYQIGFNLKHNRISEVGMVQNGLNMTIISHPFKTFTQSSSLKTGSDTHILRRPTLEKSLSKNCGFSSIYSTGP